MDTGTHIVMGIGLGGLATLDPVVSHDPALHQMIMAGTIIGSNAPDFDTILKLRSNAVYLRHHRGISHSIPAILLWPILITLTLYTLAPTMNVLHLWLWTFLAVVLHVLVDLFNAYGTQALRPFSHKWIAFGIINTFDPFIFGLHLFGIILWLIGYEPAPVFISIYMFLIVYYVWRSYVHHLLVKQVKRKINDVEEVIVSPTLNWNKWHIAVKTKDKFYVAHAKKLQISILDVYSRRPVPTTSVIEAAKKDPNLSAFLSFSPVYRWSIKHTDEGHEVRFIDLRYRSKGHYPFVAVVKLDHDLTITQSYTGWVYNAERLKKKLKTANGY
ncbi:metal-dependent hydrolase [Pueribacillus sp. YX66]|uniref:metal-dependent hydrolase n=1 Tax=Pueribacillus sp. YX66 TaxID=3229242 RepID=UPI00358CE7D3